MTDAEIVRRINDQLKSGRIVGTDPRGVARIVASYCLENSGITLSSTDALSLAAGILSREER